MCRICLSEEEPGNPLISPCKCTGSLSNIHIECLREWLEGKKHMKETPFVNSYIWKQLECEICKNPYSDSTFLKTGEEVTLLKYDVHEDARSYMVIESVSNTNSKTIHVINFTSRSRIKVGRGQNAEVRITDISVSRLHTFITCTKFGNVFIEDNQSKFGTLVQLDEPERVPFNIPIHVQIGRVLLILYATSRYSCLEKCLFTCIPKKKNKKTQSAANDYSYDEVYIDFPHEFRVKFNYFRPEDANSITSVDKTRNKAMKVN